MRQILSQFGKLNAQTRGQEGGRARTWDACELTLALLPERAWPTFREFAFSMVSRQPPGAQLSLGPAQDGYLWLREASSEAPLINYKGRHMWVRTGELRA